MHLHHRRLCLLFQAVSMVVGLSEALNPSSSPSSPSLALKHGHSTTLDYHLNATTSSSFFNVSSTTASLALNTTVPVSNISSLKALTADDSSIAKNVDGNVNIYGLGSINVTLTNGQLTFGYCIDCAGKILVCYDSDTIVPPSSNNDPRSLCGNSGQCGFQIEINAQDVYAMGDKGGAPKADWFKIEGQCPVTTMTGSKVKMYSWFQSCAPKVVNGVVTLNVKNAIKTCPLKIVGAKLNPTEVSATSETTHKDSTTDGSSSATTIWIVIGCLIFALFLLGLVIFAIWFFKLRHRKTKPTKTEPEPAKTNAAPVSKVQPQVQVKDEVKKDSAAVEPKVPTKSESKVALETPKTESKLIAEPPKSEAKIAPEPPTKAKTEEPAKVKAEIVAENKVETVEDTAGNAPMVTNTALPDPATTRNENIQARAKVAMKTLSLRSARSAKSGQKKPDSAQLRLQASNEYRILHPIHSLDRIYEIYSDSAKKTAELYPPGCIYHYQRVEALLLAPVAAALQTCHKLSNEARQVLVEYEVEFDENGNAVKVSKAARQMVRDPATQEHVKAYLFISEYGKDFYPTPAVLPTYSAPLLFCIAIGARYSDQLREVAIVEMRRHLPMIEDCWSYEERKKWHFPLNVIHIVDNLRAKNMGMGSDSSSSGRKTDEKHRGVPQVPAKREKRHVPSTNDRLKGIK